MLTFKCLAACSSSEESLYNEYFNFLDLFAVVDTGNADWSAGDIMHRSRLNNIWGQPEKLPQSFSSVGVPVSIAAVALYPTRIDLFATILSNGVFNLWHCYLANGNWTLENLGAKGFGPQVTAVWWKTYGLPRLDVFGLTPDRSSMIQIFSDQKDFTQWSDPVTIDYQGLSGVGMKEHLTSCSWGPDRLDVFGLSELLHLAQVYWAKGWAGRNWDLSNEAMLGSQPGPAVCSRGSGVLDIFGFNASSTISNIYYYGNWQARAFDIPGISPINRWRLWSAAMTTTNSLDLFFIDSQTKSRIRQVSLSQFKNDPTVGPQVDLDGVVYPVQVPMPGNAFVTTTGPGDQKISIDDSQLELGKITNWTDPATVISFFFYVETPGKMVLSLVASRPGELDTSIALTINGQTIPLTITTNGPFVYDLGTFDVAAKGYQRVDVQGVKGFPFADLYALQVEGSAGVRSINLVESRTAVAPGDKRNYYNYGRRGPSMHLRPVTSAVPTDINYYYAEIKVPKGSDPLGSYFMACGFDGGYFGIQRRTNTPKGTPCKGVVLFSVWDFVSPVDQKTYFAQLVAYSKGVEPSGFTGEGSGIRCFLPNDWTTDTTYKFIVRAKPEDKDTLFTGWFNDGRAWKPIATIRYGESRYLTSLDQFVENFNAPLGYIPRVAEFANQFAFAGNKWFQLKTAEVTGDIVGENQQRFDYAASATLSEIWVRNGGFTPGDFVFQIDGTGYPNQSTSNTSPDPVDVTKDLPEPEISAGSDSFQAFDQNGVVHPATANECQSTVIR